MSDLTIYTPQCRRSPLGRTGPASAPVQLPGGGGYGQVQPVWLSAKNASGDLVAGLRGFVFLHWLNVDVLFVDEPFRRQGLGQGLLAAAEQKARDLGARHAKLETFEWQAREFYLKQGYQEFSRIDNYIGPYYLALMKKAL